MRRPPSTADRATAESGGPLLLVRRKTRTTPWEWESRLVAAAPETEDGLCAARGVRLDVSSKPHPQQDVSEPVELPHGSVTESRWSIRRRTPGR